PECSLQSAYCDAVVDTLTDIGMELFKIHVMTDEEEKKKQYAEVNQKTITPALSYLNKKLEDRQWIVSDKITWADLAIGIIVGG
ncbi:glutathione S-transferase family protein, partial [Salmonella enterica]|uniref:glutathione S-transferase family protein n=2 Tax=cellular organisms TaxID=131567 RepID=UPI003299C2D8